MAPPPAALARRCAVVLAALLLLGALNAALAQTIRPDTTLRARVRGTVRAEDGSAIANIADVRMHIRLMARTDARGEYTIDGVPFGDQVLAVRAMGYAPVNLSVSVKHADEVFDVILTPIPFPLDTVYTRAIARALVLNGFEERSRTRPGRFLTERDFRRVDAQHMTDVLRHQPGFVLIDDRIFLRSAFGTEGRRGLGRCEPTIVIDGIIRNTMRQNEIDALPLRWVIGMELYDEAIVPSQFQLPRSGCGSVVIWTHWDMDDSLPPPPTTKKP